MTGLGNGNYGDDASLDAIEQSIDGEGLGIPGAIQKSPLGRRFQAQNPTTSEYGTGTAPMTVIRADLGASDGVADPLQLVGIDGRFNTPHSGSKGKIVENSYRIAARNLEFSYEEQGFNKTAWIMENGESQCTGCSSYYIPQSLEHARTAHCDPRGPQYGCPSNDYAQLWDREDTAKEVGHLFTGGTIGEGDVVRVNDDTRVVHTGEDQLPVVQQHRLSSTEDYLDLFEKTASDSELYYRGYEDAKAGKELDVTLAEVSDDYFHGYQQYQYYSESPQISAPQNVYDIKPNSNLAPRAASKTDNESPLKGQWEEIFGKHIMNWHPQDTEMPHLAEARGAEVRTLTPDRHIWAIRDGAGGVLPPRNGKDFQGVGETLDAAKLAAEQAFVEAGNIMSGRNLASKTANESMEQMILEKLENIEQAICGNDGCGSETQGTFNGQPHCMPGEGCCDTSTPGACPECGNSFHGHDVCSCKGGCANGMPLNTEGEDLATILRHDDGHDDWHRGMGQEPCTDEADCAAKAQEHKDREHLNPLAAGRRSTSGLPNDVIDKFFED